MAEFNSLKTLLKVIAQHWIKAFCDQNIPLNPHAKMGFILRH
ncbi:hypothetical protein OUE_0072 [Helicobacter pylori R030b]|nr:hypothetical protein OUE_0072 [Helicobacter pylori R030b]